MVWTGYCAYIRWVPGATPYSSPKTWAEGKGERAWEAGLKQQNQRKVGKNTPKIKKDEKPLWHPRKAKKGENKQRQKVNNK